MQLKVPIKIIDELEDEVIHATGMLDLASGDIVDVVYQDYDVEASGVPASLTDYTFTSGELSHGAKAVEFSVQCEPFSGRYSVTPTELLDIKVKAAKLFAGIEGRELAAGTVPAAGRKRKDVH